MDSILETVKIANGIATSSNAFDDILIMYTNSALSELNDLGVGPEDGYAITGADEKWDAVIANDKKLELVKEYISKKVTEAFDPPSNTAHMASLTRKIERLENKIVMKAIIAEGGSDA